MNGARKLCIAAFAIVTIGKLAENDNNLPYAITIAVVAVIATLVQGFLDWKK